MSAVPSERRKISLVQCDPEGQYKGLKVAKTGRQNSVQSQRMFCVIDDLKPPELPSNKMSSPSLKGFSYRLETGGAIVDDV